MYQLIAMFRHPADPAAFEQAYTESHLPLARKIPGLTSLTVSKFHPAKDGPAKYYQMAVLNFPDKDTFKMAMRSHENGEAGANLMEFARDIVEFYTTEAAEL